MENLLMRLFIKNKKEYKELELRDAYGNMASFAGIGVNLLICLGEVIIGFLIGSIAMISDGIHNVADAGGAALSLLSFKLSARKPDLEHPYGHGRMEYLFSIGFSVLLFVIAIELLMKSIERIIEPEAIEFSLVALAVMIGAMLCKIWLYSFQKKIGVKINSPILQANALESLSDIWSMAAVTVGLILAGLFHLTLDGYLGAFVSLMIAHSGYEVFKEATSSLIGNEPSRERVMEIADFVRSYEGVMGIHDLMIHDYGPGREFASIHVEVDAKRDIIDSHNMIDQIEKEALEELRLQLTIHMDPLLQDERTKGLFLRIRRVLKEYNPQYSIHDLRVVESVDVLNLLFDAVVPYDEPGSKEEIGAKIKELIEGLSGTYRVEVQVERSYTGMEDVHE